MPRANGPNASKIPHTTYRDLSEKPEVRELLQRIVTETNNQFANVEQVKKFDIITKELDHEDGELTATMKIKRISHRGPQFRRPDRGDCTDDVRHPLTDRRRLLGRDQQVRPGDHRGDLPGRDLHLDRGRFRHHLQVDPSAQLRPAGAADGRCVLGLLRVDHAWLRLLGRGRSRASSSRASSATSPNEPCCARWSAKPVFATAILTIGLDIAIRVVVGDLIGANLQVHRHPADGWLRRSEASHGANEPDPVGRPQRRSAAPSSSRRVIAIVITAVVVVVGTPCVLPDARGGVSR